MKPSQLAFLSPLFLLPLSSYGWTTHFVVVGSENGNLTYDPSNITAAPGDQVLFSYRAKNHTVTQSAFETPCQPLSVTSGKPGIYSGFMPVGPSNSTSFPTFSIAINDTTPLWFYCSQTNHCASGMVFSVNANESSPNTFEAYKTKAIQSGIKDPVIPQTFGGVNGTNPPVTHQVLVGSSDGSLVFDPTNITANLNDMVQFVFRAKNHSVTQSNFAKPCVPLIDSTGTEGAFSGFHPVGLTQDSNIPDFILQVNNTNPMWFYCSQIDHCARGMVFSINADPNGNATFEDFQKLALASGITNPHIPEVEGGTVSVFDAYNTGSMSAHPYGELSAAAVTENSKSDSSSKGAIIGGIAGAVALILLSVLGFCCYRRRRGNRAVSGIEGGGPRFMVYGADSYRPMNAPAPGAEGRTDYEPLVPPGEKPEVYGPSGAYDPPRQY